MNHNHSIGTPAEDKLRTVESANRDAITAPFSSERGVDILFARVTLGFLHSNETQAELSISFHLRYNTVANVSSDQSRQQMSWQGPTA